MHILVTGSTGFVGSHMTAALLRAGHHTRLLVRSPGKVGPVLTPLGVEPPLDVVQGDITDAASVRAALEGCEAVLHAASIFTLDPRKAAETARTNLSGMRHVIDGALSAALDPVVHVSSYAALLPPPPAGRLSPDNRPARGVGAYTTSKADQERAARAHQEQGKPVVTVMPGSVWGPGDPYLGESDRLAADILRGQMPLMPSRGGFPICDVRDIAEATARIFEPGRGPRRYLMAGQIVSPARASDVLAEVTGRRIRYLSIPGGMARGAGVACGFLQHVSPWRIPLDAESARIGTQPLIAVDDTRAERELAFHKRPLKETFADTVRSLLANGHISAKQAGLLADAPKDASA